MRTRIRDLDFLLSKIFKSGKFPILDMNLKKELPTLPEHLSSPPVFSGVRVTRSLVLYVSFEDRCLSFCPFSFCHCVVCSSLIYEF